VAQKKFTKVSTGKKSRNTGAGPFKWALGFIFIGLLCLAPFYYGHVIKTLTSSWRWVRDAKNKPHYHLYKHFKVEIPEGYKLHGIDVSFYQGKIDWQRVKKMHEDTVHVDFAFIKATEGVLITDPYFQRNWRECQKAGIPCGPYHYFRPRFSGSWQARFLLQNVKLKKGDLPVTVDVESLNGTSPEEMRKELALFLNDVTKGTGVKPIIYSGLKFYQDNLQGYFDGYPLWLSNFNHPDVSVGPGTNWVFWQHSERARVSGIVSICDFDVFKGDSVAFKRLLVK
jgi:lysozyme